MVRSPLPPSKRPKPTGTRLVDTFLTFTGYQERPNNRGYWPDIWNDYVPIYRTAPYCASSVSWMIGQLLDSFTVTGPRTVRTASSRAFIGAGSWTINDILVGRYAPRPGDLLIFWRPGGGHVAVIIRYDAATQTFFTIEANTSSGTRGSQHNGAGVHQRTRRVRDLRYGEFRVSHVVPVRLTTKFPSRPMGAGSTPRRDPTVTRVPLRTLPAPTIVLDRPRRYTFTPDSGYEVRY
jgi:hypothetical protein